MAVRVAPRRSDREVVGVDWGFSLHEYGHGTVPHSISKMSFEYVWERSTFRIILRKRCFTDLFYWIYKSMLAGFKH